MNIIKKIFIKYIFFLLFVLIFLPFKAKSQINSKTVEEKMYNSYLKKDWNDVIHIGKLAIKNNIDYFYLRKRLGIAYYEKKNYRKAIIHFKKALKFDSDNNTILEYLYYSYMLSGREDDAKVLSIKFSENLYKKLNIKENKIIENIYSEAGYTFSNNNSKNGNIDIDGYENIRGEMDRNNDILYAHLGIKSNINNYISVYQGYSNINISKTKQIRINNKNARTDNYKLKQNEYYITSNIHLTNGLKITPAFHLINVNFTSIETKYTIYHPPWEPKPTIIYKYPRKNTSFYNYLFSLSITKNISLFSISMFETYSNLNDKRQFQTGTSIVYYPLGNLNLYTNTTLVNIYEYKNRFIFDQMVGFKVFPKIWIEGFVTLGNLTNYNEKNGFIIYNIPDKITSRKGISLILPLSENIELSLRYQNIKKRTSYKTYTSLDNYITTNNIKYINQTIIGGIKWKL